MFVCRGDFCRQTPAEQDESIRVIRDNLEFYREEGFEVAVWISGLGHGAPLAHETGRRTLDGLQHIIGLYSGKWAEDSFCPMDKGLVKRFVDGVSKLAAAGVPMVMIDDDLRLSLHGAAMYGCACPLHIAEFNRRAKEKKLADHDFTREELAKILFTGKTTPLRLLWMEVEGDSMRDFCRALRAAADAVNPEMRLGHCAVLTTWDIDGIDSIEMARILAGKTRPFLRFIGAPYWQAGNNFNSKSLADIICMERMQAAWTQADAPEIEVFAEGDTYPRPRYNRFSAASNLEGYSQVLESEGQLNGILKYIFPYDLPPGYEPGYVDLTERFLPLRAEQTKEFSGKETCGLYVFEAMRKLAQADCTGLAPSVVVKRWITGAIGLMNAVSMPVSFSRTPYTKAAVVFGENARHLNASLDGLPLILDVTAARILSAAEMDVGLVSSKPSDAPKGERFELKDGAVYPVAGLGRCFEVTLKDDAEVASRFSNGKPSAWFYTDKGGRKYFVYAFEAQTSEMDGLFARSYKRQGQLFDAVKRISGESAPAALLKQPGAFLLCRKNSAGEMTVGIWNLGVDILLPDDVVLDHAYQSIRFFGGATGRLDGNKVSIDQPLYPFSFAGFTVGGK